MDRESMETPVVPADAARCAPAGGVFPLGGQCLGAKFEGAQLHGGVPQHRIDAVEAVRPGQVRLCHVNSFSGSSCGRFGGPGRCPVPETTFKIDLRF